MTIDLDKAFYLTLALICVAAFALGGAIAAIVNWK